MADEATKVFEEFNLKLVRQLPMKDALFLAALTQQCLFPGNLKEEIRAASTQSAAATQFLDQAIKPSLDIGDTEAFDKLLIVMEKSGNRMLKKLAEKIKQKLSDSAINSTPEANISATCTTTEVVPDQRKISPPDQIRPSLHSDVTNVKKSSSAEPSATDKVVEQSLPEQHSKSKDLDETKASSSSSQHSTTDKKVSMQSNTNLPLQQLAKSAEKSGEKKASSPPEQSTTVKVTTDKEKTSSTQQCTSKSPEASTKKATSLPDQNATGKNAIKQKKEYSPEKTTTSEATTHKEDNSSNAMRENEHTSFAEALQSNQNHIEWTSCSNLPSCLYNASVAVTPSGDQVYVSAWDAPDKNTEINIYCYNTKTDRWTVLPRPRHRRGTLCMIDGDLSIIGGDDPFTKEALNKVSTYNSYINSWYKRYPNMLCRRFKPGVVTYQNYVIVMGGKNGQDTTYNSIEIMDYRNLQPWKAAGAYLPFPMWNIKPTISGSYVTIAGFSTNERTNSCYQIAVENIIASIRQPIFSLTQWKNLRPVTWYETAIVPYSNPPVTIGGTSRTYLGSCVTSDITLYNPSTNLWKKVDSLASARDCVGLGLLSDNTIIVIGGTRGGEGVTGAKATAHTIVEIGTIVPNQ